MRESDCPFAVKCMKFNGRNKIAPMRGTWNPFMLKSNTHVISALSFAIKNGICTAAVNYA
jgi:hypothetical protein